MNRRFGLVDLGIILCVTGLLAVQLPGFGDDPGLGWHLATGNQILDTGKIPRFDTFLAGPERTWIADQWLSDLLIFLLVQCGSWSLAYAFFVVMYLAVYFLGLYPALVHHTHSRVYSLLGTLLAFKLGLVQFVLRPVMLGIACFAIVTIGLLRIYERILAHPTESTLKTSRVWLIVLLVVFALWSNLHPSFFVGLILVGLLPIGLMLDAAVFDCPPRLLEDRSLYVRLVLFVLLCCLGTLLTPYGIELPVTIVTLTQSGVLQGLYNEWQPPDIRGFEGVLLLLPLLILIVALVSIGRERMRLRSYEFLSICVFSSLAMNTSRMLPYFGIVIAVPFVKSLQALGSAIAAQIEDFLGVVTASKRIEQRENRNANSSITTVAIATVILFYTVSFGSTPLYRAGYGPSPALYPYRAVDYFKERSELLKRPVVVANALDWGGFLTGFSDNQVKPLIDDRTTVLGAEFYKAYFENLRHDGLWQAYLQAHNVDFTLFPPDHDFTRTLELLDEMPLVYRDSTAVVFDVSGRSK